MLPPHDHLAWLAQSNNTSFSSGFRACLPMSGSCEPTMYLLPTPHRHNIPPLMLATLSPFPRGNLEGRCVFPTRLPHNGVEVVPGVKLDQVHLPATGLSGRRGSSRVSTSTLHPQLAPRLLWWVDHFVSLSGTIFGSLSPRYFASSRHLGPIPPSVYQCSLYACCLSPLSALTGHTVLFQTQKTHVLQNSV